MRIYSYKYAISMDSIRHSMNIQIRSVDTSHWQIALIIFLSFLHHKIIKKLKIISEKKKDEQTYNSTNWISRLISSWSLKKLNISYFVYQRVGLHSPLVQFHRYWVVKLSTEIWINSNKSHLIYFLIIYILETSSL